MATIQELCSETRALFRSTLDVELKVKLHAVLLSKDGRSSEEIAAILYEGLEDVERWLGLYSLGGLEALRTGIVKPLPEEPSEKAGSAEAEVRENSESAKLSELPPAAPPAPLEEQHATKLVGEMTDGLRDSILEIVGYNPSLYGQKRGVWTTRGIAEVLRKIRGIEVAPQAIRALLQTSGKAELRSTAQFRRTRRLERRTVEKKASELAAEEESRRLPVQKPAPAQTMAPAAPAQTMAPAAPAQTTAPAAPAQTTAPAAPAQTLAPAAPAQTMAPAAPAQTTAPAAPAQTMAPAAPAQTMAPAAPAQTTAPAAPAQTMAPAAPAQTSNGTSPATGSPFSALAAFAQLSDED